MVLSYRFQIDLGADKDNLALHFNPRFKDETAIICNSKHDSVWGDEERHDNPFHPGATVKVWRKKAMFRSLTFNVHVLSLGAG